MRVILTLFLGLLLLTGCGKKVPPPVPEASLTPPLSLAPDQSGQADAVIQENTVTHWAGMLESPDPQNRAQASRALQQLGKDGFAPLFKGMQSKSTELRLTCLQAVHKPVMIAHADQTLPVLVRMLGDSEPLVRQHAAIRLGWFDGARAQSAIRELQRLAAAEPNPEVRKTVTDTIKGMELAMAGKKPAAPGANR